MKLPRRMFLHLAAGAAALLAMSRTVRARTYPTRPVRRNAVAPDAKQQFAFSFIETIASIRD